MLVGGSEKKENKKAKKVCPILRLSFDVLCEITNYVDRSKTVYCLILTSKFFYVFFRNPRSFFGSNSFTGCKNVVFKIGRNFYHEKHFEIFRNFKGGKEEEQISNQKTTEEGFIFVKRLVVKDSMITGKDMKVLLLHFPNLKVLTTYAIKLNDGTKLYEGKHLIKEMSIRGHQVKSKGQGYGCDIAGKCILGFSNLSVLSINTSVEFWKTGSPFFKYGHAKKLFKLKKIQFNQVFNAILLRGLATNPFFDLPRWFALSVISFEKMKNFPNLREVYARKCTLQRGEKIFAAQNKLEVLDISRCNEDYGSNVQDVLLEDITSLKKLYICDIQNYGRNEVYFPNLVAVGRFTVGAFKNLTNLEEVDFSRNTFSEEILNGFQKMKKINVKNTSKILIDLAINLAKVHKWKIKVCCRFIGDNYDDIQARKGCHFFCSNCKLCSECKSYTLGASYRVCSKGGNVLCDKYCAKKCGGSCKKYFSWKYVRIVGKALKSELNNNTSMQFCNECFNDNLFTCVECSVKKIICLYAKSCNFCKIMNCGDCMIPFECCEKKFGCEKCMNDENRVSCSRCEAHHCGNCLKECIFCKKWVCGGSGGFCSSWCSLCAGVGCAECYESRKCFGCGTFICDKCSENSEEAAIFHEELCECYGKRIILCTSCLKERFYRCKECSFIHSFECECKCNLRSNELEIVL